MFEKISKSIIKYKGIILLIFAIIFAVSVVGTVFLVINDEKINSSMIEYLPNDSKTKEGIVFLREKFDIQDNVTLVVRVNESDENNYSTFISSIEKIQSMDEISSVTWFGSVSSFADLKKQLNDFLEIVHNNKSQLDEMVSKVHTSGALSDVSAISSIISLSDYYGTEYISTSSMENILRHETSSPGVYDYVLIVLIDSGESTNAYNVVDEISACFAYTSFEKSGTLETGKRLLEDTMGDLPWFVLTSILSIIVILILCTSSFIEPIILLVTLLVGIIINLGTNYLFPSISIITFALSSVLQLAITMDYAIFYMHTFRKKRTALSPESANEQSIPEVSKSVLASSLTTIGGFIALYCMHFKIGTDIANVLIKGVILSMISVLVLQPILTLITDSLIKKTSHSFMNSIAAKINIKREKENKKRIEFDAKNFFSPIAKFAVWQRILLVVIAIALIVPCFIAQKNVPFGYLQLYEKSVDTEEAILASELGDQLILAVPLIPNKNKSQKEFVENISNINKKRITGILGAFTVLKVDEKNFESLLNVLDDNSLTNISSFKNYLSDDSFKPLLYEYGLSDEDIKLLSEISATLDNLTDNINADVLKTYFRKIDEKWFTLYTISFNGNSEDEEAQTIYKKISELCITYFGQENYYPVGTIISSYEMDEITPHDFLLVTIISIAIIYLIVTILLRNPLKSFFIVAIIELGIWINLAFNYIFGSSINFMVYIIISSVQLGCTVDYAILYANTFENNRNKFSLGKECARETSVTVSPAILTSASIIGIVCLCIYFISSNIIIKQLTGMLARGALISLILVMLLQTAIWSFFKTEKKQKNFEEKLKNIEENEKSNTDSVIKVKK